MISDGRLLVAGVLGAFVVGRVACGSPGVIRAGRGASGSDEFEEGPLRACFACGKADFEYHEDLQILPDGDALFGRGTDQGWICQYCGHAHKRGSGGVVRKGRESMTDPDAALIVNTKMAYDDVVGTFVWRYSRYVSPESWAKAMRAALAESRYNLFDIDRVARWFAKYPGIAVKPARRNSVMAYVRGPDVALRKMDQEAKEEVWASEVDLCGRESSRTLSLWWD